MKKNIRSYNSSITFRENLIPSVPQALLELVLAAIILTALNGRAIWSYLSTGFAPVYTIDLGGLVSQYIPWVYDGFDYLTHGRVAQALFWLFVGCVSYIVIWLIGNVLTNIRNDVVADMYVHPKSYNRAGYWSGILSRKVFFVCLLVVFVVYIYAFGRVSQTLANLGFQAVVDFQFWNSSFIIFDSILGMALLLHFLFLILRIVKNTWRFIYKDL